MAKAQALVGMVTDVQPHPTISGLDVVTIGGKINVANREPPAPEGDGTTFARYEIGDYAVLLTENLILPDWLIKHLDMWNHEKNKGRLGGGKGNRLKSRKIPNEDGGILSEVALLPVYWTRKSDEVVDGIVTQHGFIHFAETYRDGNLIPRVTLSKKIVSDDDPPISPIGQDVAWNLGIEEIYEPQT